ncbi:MAG: DNA alkylation repair protein [Bacteroidales bacterium]|jgi:3-methyladenine DNA glycosylase AlkD
MTAENVQKELRVFASAERKKAVEWFFKTGKGQYGEGDIFLGVSSPDMRRVSRKYQDLPFAELQTLIASPIHEERSCALSILVQRYEKGGERADRAPRANPEPRKTILDFYLHNMQYINNWDLVDCSAHKILGRAIHEGLQEVVILDRLAVSDILWERRIAIIATMYFIHKGQLDHTFRLAERLLADREDLMHKAVGWMLREAWKKDPAAVETFLIKHYPQIPRTALRYAIEKMEETKRQRFLKGRF